MQCCSFAKWNGNNSYTAGIASNAVLQIAAMGLQISQSIILEVRTMIGVRYYT